MARKKYHGRETQNRNENKKGYGRNRTEEDKKPTSYKNTLNPIVAKTAGQETLIDAIKQNEIVICDGPAGTGKTYISFGLALNYYFNENNISRIIVVRPTIPAGDDDALGYLPGNLNEKMAPYLAPLICDSASQLIKLDSYRNNSNMYDRGSPDPLAALTAKINIEIIPLAYIRGRTLHNSFIILDEAQNCTSEDLKLFLTRTGRNSKVVIEGDTTQTDRDNSGLLNVMSRLEGMGQVGIVRLTERDIIRNPLIAQIIKRLG